jgi:hypothetical protein
MEGVHMKKLLIVAVVLLLASGTAVAEKEKLNGPPASATEGLLDCTNAIPIACGGSHSDDTSLYPSVVSSYNSPGWSLNGPEVVYELTVGSLQQVTLDLTFPTAGDLALLVLSACDETTVMDYSDAYGDGVAEQIVIDLLAGTYIVVVEGWYADDMGAYTLTVGCEAAPEPPVNDLCDGAIAIERCTSGIIEGDLTLAHDDYTPSGTLPSCTGYGAAGKDVVYVMDLLVGDEVYLSLEYVTYFDESIYIITDCADPNGSCVIGEDGGSPEEIFWTCDADGTYYVICDAWSSGSGGEFTLTYDITCPVTPNEETSWGKVKSMFE